MSLSERVARTCAALDAARFKATHGEPHDRSEGAGSVSVLVRDEDLVEELDELEANGLPHFAASVPIATHVARVDPEKDAALPTIDRSQSIYEDLDGRFNADW
jgi:hypothetical protein